MAHFVANTSFDYTKLNLNQLITGDTGGGGVYQDVNLNILGYYYADIIDAQYTDGGTTHDMYFGGTSLFFSMVDGSLMGGYLTGIFDSVVTGPNADDLDLTWGLLDMYYSAISIDRAIDTASTADDFAVLEGILSSSDEIYLSAYADRMRGYGGDDTLSGGAGNDTLYGDSGYDFVLGGDGNDLLSGGSGMDVLRGDAGADILVFNAQVGKSGDSDRFVMTGSHNDTGQDTLSSFSLSEDTLRIVAGNVANFAHGTDTTVGAGTGTEVAGNRASFSTNTGLIELNQSTNNNWADAGDVVLDFLEPSATLTEAAFEARLQYNLTGTSGNNSLTTGRLADTLNGGAGNDTLDGGLGKDLLTGGAGVDRFVFSTTLGTSNLDTLSDFVHGTDKIVLDDDIFTKLGVVGSSSGGALSASRLQLGTAANDSLDRLIYDQASGKLYYDADGSGSIAKVQIALIGTSSHASLSASDFLIVA